MAIAEITSAPVIHLVPIKDIKLAVWNPVNRQSEKRLVKLRLSIDDLGLFYPVLLDPKNNLIDGHRRLAVAKSFGWKRIPAITLNAPLDQSYGSIQLSQQQLTGNDRIGVYLNRPSALAGNQRTILKAIEDNLGRWALLLLYKSGAGPGYYTSAVRVVKYLDKKVDLETTFRWLVKHKHNNIYFFIKGEMPPDDLIRLIKADKPITLDDL